MTTRPALALQSTIADMRSRLGPVPVRRGGPVAPLPPVGESGFLARLRAARKPGHDPLAFLKIAPDLTPGEAQDDGAAMPAEAGGGGLQLLDGEIAVEDVVDGSGSGGEGGHDREGIPGDRDGSSVFQSPLTGSVENTTGYACGRCIACIGLGEPEIDYRLPPPCAESIQQAVRIDDDPQSPSPWADTDEDVYTPLPDGYEEVEPEPQVEPDQGEPSAWEHAALTRMLEVVSEYEELVGAAPVDRFPLALVASALDAGVVEANEPGFIRVFQCPLTGTHEDSTENAWGHAVIDYADHRGWLGGAL